MSCFKPLQAFRSRVLTKSGKRGITFSRDESCGDFSLLRLPCGRCIGCRIKRSREWAIRCVHEASLHKHNSFITLTFNDKWLKKLCPTGSLDVTIFQKFMKRLRYHTGLKIRFYHCGEYGERYGRPHYHACLFGIDFPDKKPFKVVNGITLYRSAFLESVWTYGYSSIGDVTFQSAAYVARYVMKKVVGSRAVYHYQRDIDTETGEVLMIKPEYSTMSRNKAIGREWFEKFKGDFFPKDYAHLGGKKISPPRYYSALYEAEFPDEFAKIKRKRIRNARLKSDDQTSERLAVKEEIQQLKLNRLVRGLDMEL